MKRILRHVGGKDFKKTHQRKLDEQRALYLEKRERQIQELEKAIIIKELSEPYKSDWRSEIDEGMTSSALLSTTLPETGDVDIVDTGTTLNSLDSSLNYSRSGDVVTLAGDSNNIVGGTHTAYRVARYTVDATNSSTLKITISKGGGTSSWTDRGGASNFDDGVSLNINDRDDFFAPSYYDGNLSSGTHIIPLPGNYKRLYISIEQFAKVGETGSLTITGLSLQRRTPVNVLVGLDNPEATNFIRTDPIMRGLSAQERKKRLEDMLDAGDEYLLKQVGLQGSKARPADTGNIVSWQQDVSSRSRSFGKRQSISSTGISQQLYKNDLKAAGYSDKEIAQKTNVRYIEPKKNTDPAKEANRIPARASSSIRTDAEANPIRSALGGQSAVTGKQSPNKDSYMDIRVGDQKSSPVSQPQSKPTSKQSANTDTQIAGLPPGMFPIDPTPPIKGPSGYKKPGTYDPNQFYKLGPGSLPSPNLPNTGPGLSKSGQDTQIAWNTPVLPTGPSTPVKYDKRMKEYVPSGRGGFPGNYPREYLPSASKNKKQPMVASYEPQGQVLSEKKLKSPKQVLNNKIPE